MIGFCYIDGNHNYEFVQRDFANADEFLASGGYVFLDDSADHLGVEKVAREALASNRYELVVCNPNHLLRKKPSA
ncbi:MAG: class I SAM-dependent methyltransferase [Burkholderiales bacterium]